MVERVATKPATCQPTLRTERTTSFISPVGSVHDDEVLPALDLHQKLAEVNQDISSRVPTKRSTSLIPYPALPVERIASFPPEPDMAQRKSTRKLTALSSRQSTLREAEVDPKLLEQSLSLISTSDEELQEEFVDEPEVEDISFEAPVERIRKAITIDQAREDTTTPASLSLSSLEVIVGDVEEEEPVLSRGATGQSTRRSSIYEPEPEQDFEPPVMRMRKYTLQTSGHEPFKVPSPAAEEETEPDMPRQPSRQPTGKASVAEHKPEPDVKLEAEAGFAAPAMRMRQSTMQASRRQSLRSPSPIMGEEVEDPIVIRISTRWPTRKSTEVVTSPIEDLESDAPILRMRRASTVPPPPTPEPEAIEIQTQEHTLTPPRDASPEPIMRKVTTRRPTERIPSPVPLIRKVTTRRPTKRVSSPELMVRRVTTRRPAERDPSLEPVVRRVTTRKPTEEFPAPESIVRKMSTRRRTERVSSPEPMVERVLTRQQTERSPSPELVIRKATTRRPTEEIPSPQTSISRVTTRQSTERTISLEPAIEPAIERALTHQATEPLPPPEEIIRRVTTRKRTEPVEEPPAPPSSPSTQAEEPSLLARGPTSYARDDVPDLESSARAAKMLSRTTSFAPEIQRQVTGPSSWASTLRRRSTQSGQIMLPESASSSSCTSPIPEDIEDPAQGPFEGDGSEKFVLPVESIRRPTTTYETPADDVLSEPTFDRQPTVSRRQSTSERSPIASRQPTIARQPTVQECRATFERVMTIPSRRSTIMSDPTNVDLDSPILSRVSTRQATITESPASSSVPTTLSRKATESVSRQPTRRVTESVDIPVPVSRHVTTQVTRQITVPPSRKPSEYGVPGLIQRNAEEGSGNEETLEEPEDEESLVERQVTRQPTAVSRRPTRVPAERLEEPAFKSQATRRSTVVSQKATGVPTEQIEEPDTLERQTTEQPTLRSEPSEERIDQRDDAEQETVMPVRRDREPTRVSREPTRLEEQVTLPVEIEEVPEPTSTSSSSASVAEAPYVPSRRTTRASTLPSRRTTTKTQREASMQPKPQTTEQESPSVYSDLEPELETVPAAEQLPARRATTIRTMTGLTGLTASSSESQEYGSMEQMQKRAASRRATLVKTSADAGFEPPIMRMRQEIELEQPGQDDQDEPEPGPLDQVQSRRASRVPTLPIEAALSKPSSRMPTWSTEALVKEKLADDVPSVLEKDDLPAAERQASVVSRKSTTVSRTPTDFSRRPTRQPMIPSRQATLGQIAPSPHLTGSPLERAVANASSQPTTRVSSPSQSSVSTLSFVSCPDVLEDEPPAPVTCKITQQPTVISRQATAKENSPSPQIPSRRAITVSRQPTAQDESFASFVAVGRMAEHDSDSEPLQEDEPLEDAQSAPPSRKATPQMCRNPRRGLIQREAREEPVADPVMFEETPEIIPAPSSRRPTSQVSRQPTRAPTQREGLENKSSPAVKQPLEPVSRAAEVLTESSIESTETEELTDLQRQPTVVSLKVTRVPILLPAELPEEEPAPLSRRATTCVSRQPTRAATTLFEPPVQRDVQPDDEAEGTRLEADEEHISAPRRATTRVSRQPTRVATARFEPPVQRGVRPDQETIHDTVVEPDSSHSSVLDEPLAAYDVYHALPEVVPDVVPEEVPRPVSKMPTRKDSVVRVQEEAAVTRPPTSPPAPPSRHATTLVPTPQSTMAKEADPEVPVYVDTTERIERAPTMPALVLQDVETTPPESPKVERQKIPFSPEVDERPPQVLTSPSSPIERERKASTGAPGIVAPPPQLVQRDRKPTEVEKKSRKKLPNYPPERQYPPAPAYPVRDTPGWTKPDTYTPPPKSTAEPAPKKRGFFGLGPKPREAPQPIQRSAPEPRNREPEPQVRRPPEPHRDRFMEPFRHAAPGPAPGPPWGTLQRPRDYPTTPGHEPVRRAPAPIPVRRIDHFPRATPAYAHKDDYYPRLVPIVQDRRNDHPQAQHTPIRRAAQPPPQVAPVRRDARPQPSYPAARARKNYPSNYQERPRAWPNVPYRDEARQQPLRSQAPEPTRHQPPAKQDVRDQEKASARSQAPPSQRRPQAHEEPARAGPVPQENAVPRAVRRDARSNSQAEGAPFPQESADQARDRRAPEAKREVPRSAQEANQPRRASRGEPDRPATAKQHGDRSPSKTTTTAAQRPQEQAPEPRGQPTGRHGEQSTAKLEAEASQGEDDEDLNSEPSSQDQRDSPSRHSIDGVSFPNARPSLSHKDTGATSDRSRGTSAQGPSGGRRQPTSQGTDERRPSAQDSVERRTSIPELGVAKTIMRTPTHSGNGTRASEPADPQTARKASTIGSRRPSTALGKTRTQRRSSVAGEDTGRSPATRATTGSAQAPTISIQPEAPDRRASMATGAPVSRATDTGATGAGKAAPPTNTAKPSTAELRNGGSVQDPQATSVGPNPERKATGLPRRRSSVPLYDTSSSDPYAAPQRAAPAKSKPGPGRKDSVPASRSPTRGWFGGKANNQNQQPPAQTAGAGAGRDTSPSKFKKSEAGAGEQPKGQQQPGKIGAKAVQRSSGLAGRWGWGWGRR